MRTYEELSLLTTFEERFEYLRLDGMVGVRTFGSNRYLNQDFYHDSLEWKRVRDEVIIRDNGCDLGIPGREIYDRIIIHHMNPISSDDIIHGSDILLNPNYLICVTHKTHNAIHYGDKRAAITPMYAIRYPNDTCPWKIGRNNDEKQK